MTSTAIFNTHSLSVIIYEHMLLTTLGSERRYSFFFGVERMARRTFSLRISFEWNEKCVLYYFGLAGPAYGKLDWVVLCTI